LPASSALHRRPRPRPGRPLRRAAIRASRANPRPLRTIRAAKRHFRAVRNVLLSSTSVTRQGMPFCGGSRLRRNRGYRTITHRGQTQGDAIQKFGTPEMVNTDQGSQFTSFDWTARLKRLPGMCRCRGDYLLKPPAPPRRPWPSSACPGLLRRNRNRSTGAGSSIDQPEILPKIGD
jgi:hypothetical protein